MVYYLFWTAYSTKVDAAAFERFFGVPLKKAYGWEMTMAKVLGFVTEEHGIYQMTLKGAFYYHYYENFYTLPISTKCGASCGRKLFRKKSCYKKERLCVSDVLFIMMWDVHHTAIPADDVKAGTAPDKQRNCRYNGSHQREVRMSSKPKRHRCRRQ